MCSVALGSRERKFTRIPRNTSACTCTSAVSYCCILLRYDPKPIRVCLTYARYMLLSFSSSVYPNSLQGRVGARCVLRVCVRVCAPARACVPCTITAATVMFVYDRARDMHVMGGGKRQAAQAETCGSVHSVGLTASVCHHSRLLHMTQHVTFEYDKYCCCCAYHI